jgi:hypothetical protein
MVFSGIIQGQIGGQQSVTGTASILAKTRKTFNYYYKQLSEFYGKLINEMLTSSRMRSARNLAGLGERSISRQRRF